GTTPALALALAPARRGREGRGPGRLHPPFPSRSMSHRFSPSQRSSRVYSHVCNASEESNMRSPLIPWVLAVALALPAGAAPARARSAAPRPPRAAPTAAADEEGLPLEPARWARFTTSRGTWMSLDVSPDGQTIVFDLLGDLYTMPITGGTATRLTHGIAHDMQPRFSPDGRTVVFVSDRSGDENVWLLSLDGGEPRPLTTGEDAN